MKIAEIRAAARADGYTHVETFGGPLALDAWQPYGNVPGGANYRPQFPEWEGDYAAGVVVDRPRATPRVPGDACILGRWPLTKGV